jgi:adenylate cyclase
MSAVTRWLKILGPLLVILLAVGVRAVDPVALQELRFKVFDAYQRFSPRPYPDSPVIVVDIDNPSLDRQGQWPWPRTLLAELTGKLQQAGAAAIAFDIIFAEPDRTSPGQVMESWPQTERTAALRRLASEDGLPNHDRIFADSLAAGRTVTGFALDHGATNSAPPVKAGFAASGPDPKRFVPRFNGAVSNIPLLSKAASGNGSLNVIPESDGVVRRIPLFVTDGESLYPSLAAEALRVAQGASTYLVKSAGAGGAASLGSETGITAVKIGRAVLPTDPSGRIWLYDSGHRPERTISAWKVLTGEVDAARLRGAIAIVGSSAAGLKDQHATPLSPGIAGVTLHAQMLEQVLTGSFLGRPDWADGAETLAVFLIGLLVFAPFLLPRLPMLWSVGFGAIVVAGVAVVSWQAFAMWRWLFDPVYPAMTGVAVYVAASLPRYLEVEGEKRRIRAAFAQYMAPSLVEQLAGNPKRLRLGGETRDLTLLFCDIRGFTSLAERMDADEVTRLLNRFLTPMSDAIMETGGTIDKYMGDAIMAFWNAPLDDPDHAAHACRAAQEMRRRLADLNASIARDSEADGKEPVEIRIGIGLNSGPCSVGNMGSNRRFDYSALGDNVNLASRLEGQCKTYGVEVVISETTRAGAEDVSAVELDLIRVKGRRDPARIYTILAASDVPEDLTAKHAAMLSAYRARDWDRADALIAECRTLMPGEELSGVYDLYAARIAELRADPPGDDWDGVFEATTK